MVRPLQKGIYVPLPTFFDANEDLDLKAFTKHIVYTAKAGILPVVCGSMGEAVHLSPDERVQLVKTARAALDDSGLHQVPIMGGIGAASTRETIILAQRLAEAGADHAILITGGYYAGALIKKPEAIKKFYVDVSEASPIPVLLYNFPGVTGGIDMTSDLVEDIAKAAPNTCGIKLTCGAVGKLTRIAATVNSEDFANAYPRRDPSAPFLVIDGFIDFLLPSIAAGASGTITGVPNFAPLTCMKLWEYCVRPDLNVPEVMREAQDLQALVSRADWAASNANIPGMKRLLQYLFGYGHLPRGPLPEMSEDEADKLLIGHSAILNILEYEKTLRDQGYRYNSP
ncbi:hypothetical protein I302_101155 [Kwoniella bestiolae CBS 10118]|uniref:Dihydrodipicolinate synthase n=1 Tax=Kwoniella bestiolae CBS 10118 TaxID=1296100 RepID=A0A1B9G776_9TREE|nr:hypothetical protein I302_04530 [Kwoniella bestiolae CBS 10118]OCF26840.1 hypothetical protein I302_04530 [Kwoniella bestiolae CBS 10118]